MFPFFPALDLFSKRWIEVEESEQRDIDTGTGPEQGEPHFSRRRRLQDVGARLLR